MQRMTTLFIAAMLAAGVAAAQPANDDCASATPIAAPPFADSVDVALATTEGSDPSFPCAESGPVIGARTVWYSYTATEDVALEIDTAGSDYDTLINVLTGTCESTSIVECSDDEPYVGTLGRGFVALHAGETVLIQVAARTFPPAGTQLQLSIDRAPPGHPAKRGGEFVVNTTTYGHQGYYMYRATLSACAGPAGEFVVVWVDDYRDTDSTLFGQRFTSDGSPTGGEFQVSADTAYAQEFPALACGADGDFVVSWTSVTDLGHEGRVKRFDGTGASVTSDIAIPDGRRPGVTTDGSGNFLVAYEYDGGGIRARRFDATGAAVGGELVLASDGYDIDAAGNTGGASVVVWSGGAGLAGRQVDATGTLGATFTATAGGHSEPAVSMNSDGEFIVTWNDYDDRVLARRYDAGGLPVGAAFPVDPGVLVRPESSDVALADDGGFVVVWDDLSSYRQGLTGRRYDAADQQIGSGQFQVETENDFYQLVPNVAGAASGDFVVAWVGVDGYGYGIRARRFTLAPAPPTDCPAVPRGDCKEPMLAGKGNITLKDKTPDTSDAVIWKWVKGEATSTAEIGDPLATDAYTLCVYDGGDALLLQAVVGPGGTCGTRPCWKDLAGLGFKYADKTGANGDVRKILLKSGSDGSAKVIVKAQGDGLAMPALPPALPLRAQLASTTGACWSAAFDVDGVTRSTSTVFSGKPAAGSP